MAAQAKTIELLLQLSNVGERRTRSEAIAGALRAAILLLDADAASVVLGSSRRRAERLILYAGSDTPAAVPLTPGQSEALRSLTEERQALVVPDLSDTSAFATADACPGVEAGPVLFVPVDQRDPVPGFLAIYRKRGRARYTAAETESMLLLAAWLSNSLENLRLAVGADRSATTDDLTETYNARFLKTTLKKEVRRANRYSQELSVMWVEIDGMPEFCETHGAERGNYLLKEAASVLAQQVRSFDSLGKSGEARFLVVLPQTNLDGARGVAERMRTSIAGHAFSPAEAGQVTVTVGIASFPQDGLEVEALLALADRALDQGRAEGRNRVSTSARKAA